MTKKTILLFVCLLTIATVHSQVEYQLPNPGFEQWDGGKESEPTHWNTFESSDGSYSSMASANHHYRRSGHRTGGNGSYYLTIYTKSIMGVKANGNMTTGRIHAGSLTASSSDNYNYTQRSNSNHCQLFTATPDSMYVWVSFYAENSNSTAQVEAVIHGDNDFKAPNDVDNTSKYNGRAVAQTKRTTSSASQMNWTQLKVPFVYDGNVPPTYILVNMTTNKTPGGGDKNDSLSVDDIEFIYSAWLNGIDIAGNPVTDFDKGRFNYTLHIDNLTGIDIADINCYMEADDATVEKSLTAINDTSLLASINVTAEDGITVKTYQVTLTTGIVVGTGNTHDCNNNKGFSVFPNPATDRIYVYGTGIVSLFDIQGRKVLEKECTDNSTVIRIDGLRKGLYLLKSENSTAKVLVR